MKENFDYAAAMSELDKIARKIEDPATGLDEVEKLIKLSDELIANCREYLRTLRTKAENL